jgi:Flp pilus assembly protein TadD
MTLSLGLLLALWIAVENCNPKAPATDSNTGADAGAGIVTATDAGAATAPGTDAGPDALSPHELEEAAKDELDNARAALQRGDLSEAAAALERANTFDPNNPDIDALRQQVLGVQPDGG